MREVKVNGESAPQFEYSDLGEPTDCIDVWSFSSAMVSRCRPLFDDCFDNHEVEAKLRASKVIRKNNRTDTESCALWVYFSKREGAEKFIDRLNEYLRVKVCKLAEARRY